MEEISARSKNYKPTTPDQPTMTWTRWRGREAGVVVVVVVVGKRARVTAGMKGGKMETWKASRISQGRDLKEQGARGRQRGG